MNSKKNPGEWMINMSGEKHKRQPQRNWPATAEAIQAYGEEQCLLKEATRGNRAAYAELYGRHAKMLYHVVFRMTNNHEDTEDVLQDAGMKAFLHLPEFQGRSAFSSWLTRIAINCVLMMRRKRMRRRELTLEPSGEFEEIQIADTAPDAEEQLLKRESVHRIHAAVECLPPSLRLPLQHQLAEDLPIKDLANRLGISVAATKSRLMRARVLVAKTVVQAHRRSGRRSIVNR